MKCTNASWIIVWVFVMFWSSLSFGAIPQSISYQGRLTNSVGVPLDTTVNLVFTICSDSLGTNSLWSETHSGVVIKDGLFQVMLGSISILGQNVFDGSKRWLGVQLQGGPAPTALIPIVSTAYAYRSANSDTADYVKNAGGSNCADCNTIFVNVIGPDSVYSSSGTAFLVKVEGYTASELRGVEGYASNAYNGHAYGGYFSTSAEGTGIHYGLRADGNGAATVNTYGVLGSANNTSSGNTYGGRFTVNSIGTGDHYALSSNASSSSSSPSYGIDATSYNTSGGDAYGGRFSALTNGTGVHYALSADAAGSSSTAVYGLNSTASNSSTGTVYGAALKAEAGGTGTHYGVNIHSDGAGVGGAFGVWSEAENTSAGSAYGGYFRTTTGGTGNHYGVSGNANGASDATSYASYGYATNSSTGDAYGGYFITSSTGTGIHYGLKAEGNGSTASAVHGVNGTATNTSSGTALGGMFICDSDGSGIHYGVHAQSSGSSSQNTYAVYGTASNFSNGRAYGGYFAAGNSGTGEHTGVYAEAYNDDNHDCFGVYGYANNTSSGAAYGGYFYAPSGGSGVKCGVYAEGGTNWAGWFQGDVQVMGSLYVSEDKFATVKVDNGEYRGVSCQESPEAWFEDFGESRLVNGSVHVGLDQLYLQTVTIDSSHPMQVFIQLYDEDCNGTAVKRGTTGFDVIEVQNGTSNASFSYRVVAKRKGYEDVRLPLSPGPTPEEMKAKSTTIRAKFEADKATTQAENQRMNKESEASKRNPATEEEK